MRTALHTISELQSVIYHMESHSVTCLPLSPQPDRPVLDLHNLEGWKAELTRIVGYNTEIVYLSGVSVDMQLHMRKVLGQA